ncbi:hypothetical protein CO678_15935 [Bradyrhizobium diazoefficiens]|uniref:hypothetical protein n=1 Tax=Bradyrhizobium diazoefficiens TaxID=1355477 RepID=UPI000BE7DDFC|nr:hypothetical protein [Bradyrhizobium diazoefficiens]PDT60521.1 hypothetical protein CO678_15935 [Bradyrhizobium diazoefficiens]
MSSPYPGEPTGGPSFLRLLIASVGGAALVASLAIVGFFVAERYGIPFVKKSEPAAVALQTSPQQTEALFLNGLKAPDTASEWWSARADHRLVAYAVLNCKQLLGVSLDLMPRPVFSALLLDLTPSGSHVFLTKDGDGALLAAHGKEAPPLALTNDDHDLLSLSDSIARARIAAAEGAQTNVPRVQGLGFITLVVAALATLFVTLQGKVRQVEPTDDEKKALLREKFRTRVSYALLGPGAGFRWVAFFAIFLSILATSLTGVKQVYDPTRNLTQNTRALLDLRQLHQDVILGVRCDNQSKAVRRDGRVAEEWAGTIRRMRATIIPEYGAYANLDVGGSSQRPDPTRADGRDADDARRAERDSLHPNRDSNTPIVPNPPAAPNPSPTPAGSTPASANPNPANPPPPQ